MKNMGDVLTVPCLRKKKSKEICISLTLQHFLMWADTMINFHNNHSMNNLFWPLTLSLFLWNRKTIKVLFPREAVERQRYQEFSPDYNSLLSEFESLNVNEGRNHSGTSSGLAQVVHRQQVNFSLSRIVLIILSILGVIMVSAKL